MIRILFTFFTIFAYFSHYLPAQINLSEPEICASDEVNRRHAAANPLFQEILNTQEELLQRHLAQQNADSRMLYRIPVVVHIIHTGTAVGDSYNISDAQVQAGIDYLNKMFDADASEGFNGADTQIEFALAQRDPNCQPTNGINRIDFSSNTEYVADGVSSGGSGVDETIVKALSRWPNSQYYNIWVVNKIGGFDGNSGNGVAGFAYFPGASAELDGTIMLAAYMRAGAEVLGHEIGHALNLYHTFEGDQGGAACPTDGDCQTEGDRVCDTDPHIRSNGCPQGDQNACTGTTYGSVVTNHMDYSSCSLQFTFGQSDRMRATLETSRASLLNSSVLDPPPATQPADVTCIPTVSDPSNFYGIGPVLVRFNTINSPSGSFNSEGVYVDMSCNHRTTVNAGGTYGIEISTQLNPQKVRVYIDFNNDGDFVDNGEAVFSSDATGTPQIHSGNIDIPSNAPVIDQPVRMRVVSDYVVGNEGPCGELVYGQAEDYGIIIEAIDPPTIVNPTSSNVTYDSAQLGAEITEDGGANVTERGIVWSVNVNPVIGGSGVTKVQEGGSGTGVFSLVAGGLPDNQMIYFRGYATNSAGTSYTTDATFTTEVAPTLPTIIDPSSANITNQSADLGANVTDNGNAAISETGIVWSTSPDPVIGGSGVTKVQASIAALGVFMVSVSGLPEDTDIYFRGYAINVAGTAYTSDATFKTLPQPVLPTIINPTSASITHEAAMLGAEVTDDGNATITERGIVWGTSTDPVIGETGVVKLADSGTGLGTFTRQANSLPSNTMIYFRGYAINSAGTAYTNTTSFTTDIKPGPPLIINPTVSDITSTSGLLGAEIIADGGSPITERGFVWSLNPDPALGRTGVNQMIDGETDVSEFQMLLDGLAKDVDIYFRGYATNESGIAYTEEKMFHTPTDAFIVDLLDFSATPLGFQVRLDWSIIETNNDHFIVERSLDSMFFETVGQVSGIGTSPDPQDYTFTDTPPLGGALYYRVKVVGLQGDFIYTEVVKIFINPEVNITVFPNPVVNVLTIQVDEVPFEKTFIIITDAIGRSVYQQEISNLLGEPLLLDADLSNLTPGMYFLALMADSWVFGKRLLKVE